MDSDKIKGFFVNHIEKLALGTVGIFAVLLLYQGISLEPFTETTPDKLKTEAEQVRLSVDDDHNETVVDPRKPDFDIVKRTNEAQKPLDASSYGLVNTWVRTSSDSSIKRVDPKLSAPIELLVSGQARVVARRSFTPEYDLQDLEDAEELEKIEKKPKRRPKPKRQAFDPYGGEEMEDGGYGMDMEMEMEDGGYDMGGSMAVGGSRKFPKDGNFGAEAKSTTQIQTDRRQEPIPQWALFVAGSALVPHQTMYDAYKTALKDAAGYNRMRDVPTYNNFEVQRADVTNKSVDELTEEDWVTFTNRESTAFQYVSIWAGFASEPVDEFFRDIAFTTWVPPVLLDDYRTFARHPKIPLSAEDLLAGEEEEEKVLDIDKLKLRTSGAAVSRGGGGYGEDYGADMMDGGYGGGGDMYGGDMYGGGAAMLGPEEPQPEFKLMRFYDFYGVNNFYGGKDDQPLLGHTYVYRVRVGLEDPNFPELQDSQPELKSLDPTVYERVSKLIDIAVEKEERISQIWSEWSAPSAPVKLPDLVDAYAGPVESVKTQSFNINGRQVELNRDAPKAKMVLRSVNPQYSGMVPMWVDVTEGSVLSKEMENGEVVDPITNEVKKLADAKIQSQSTVIAIQGGQPLSIIPNKEEEMVLPSTMLLFDSDGGLRVTGEVQDQENYRAWSFAEDRGL